MKYVTYKYLNYTIKTYKIKVVEIINMPVTDIKRVFINS